VEAVPKQPLLGHQPGLEGLRGLAIVPVVFFHVFDRHPKGGWLGVDLFFVLSGFLITTLLLEEHERHGTISLRAFYLRRALRLLPALWAMLAVTVTALAAAGMLGSAEASGAIAGFTYTSNFAGEFGVDLSYFRHLWSLAIEEQFYFAWPLLLILSLRHLKVRTVAILTCCLVVSVTLVRAVAFLDMRFDSILIGCAASLALCLEPQIRRVATTPGVFFAAVGVLLFLGLTVGWTGRESGLFVLISASFSLAAAVVVVGALDGTGGALLRLARRLLTVTPLLFVGRISYALYLWHLPIQGLVNESSLPATMGTQPSRLLIVILSVAVATCSYFFVEKPFLRQKRRLARTPSI